jgi:hypothetical protein
MQIDGVDDKTGQIVRYYAPMTEGRDGSDEARVKLFTADDFLTTLDDIHDSFDIMDAIRLASGDADTKKRVASDKETKKTAAIVDKVSNLYDPKKSDAENYSAIMSKMKGEDPNKVSAAIQNHMAMRNSDVTRAKTEAETEKAKYLELGDGEIGINLKTKDRLENPKDYDPNSGSGGKAAGAMTEDELVKAINANRNQASRIRAGEGIDKSLIQPGKLEEIAANFEREANDALLRVLKDKNPRTYELMVGPQATAIPDPTAGATAAPATPEGMKVVRVRDATGKIIEAYQDKDGKLYAK